MEIFLMYIKAFLVGGGICLIGQVLLNFTKLTPARILVIFLLLGVLLQATGGLYQHLIDFAGAGASVPITGFGYLLAKGAMEGARISFIKALTGGFSCAIVGILSAIVFGYLNAIIFRSKIKRH